MIIAFKSNSYYYDMEKDFVCIIKYSISFVGMSICVFNKMNSLFIKSVLIKVRSDNKFFKISIFFWSLFCFHFFLFNELYMYIIMMLYASDFILNLIIYFIVLTI